MNVKKLLSLWGLKWNPFSPELPPEALLTTAKVDNFAWRVEQLVQEGGFALVTGESGTGKSVALRIVDRRLSMLRDVVVGVLERPQSKNADFYRELGDIFSVKLSPSNRWGGFRALRQRWKTHLDSARIKPVLLIDEAQQMEPDVLNELRILSSADFDATSLLTVVLAGDSRLLNQILAQIRMAYGIRRGHYQPIEIETDRDSTTIRATSADASIGCQLPFGSRPARFAVPMCTLAEIKSSARHDVDFQPSEGKVRTRSWEISQWQSVYRDFVDSPEHPPQPTWLVSNDRMLGQVLQQTSLMTDVDSMRYTLGCLRLRGADGQIAATDGRQAFIHRGFSFPVDEVLVPASSLRKLRCLSKCTSISVGRSADWLSLRMAVGPERWAVDLRIVKKGRYPNVDQCIPHESAARTTVTISDHDAVYLLKNLGSFLGRSEDCSPVTLELANSSAGSRTVVLRFQGQDREVYRQAAPELACNGTTVNCELDLAGSTFDHGATSVAMNHRYLLNAMRHGFRKIHLQSAGFPAFCSAPRRNYVWSLAHAGAVLQATPGAIEFSSIASRAVA